MSTFYNTSTVTYDDSGTPYNGAAITYTYVSTGITLSFVVNSAYNVNGGVTTYTYDGSVSIIFDPTSSYVTGFVRVPTITGITLRIVPNSNIVIRQYKKVKDPIRTGGCPNCGTFLYNN